MIDSITPRPKPPPHNTQRTTPHSLYKYLLHKLFQYILPIGVRVSDIMLSKKYSNNYQKQDQKINQNEIFSSLEKI